MLWIYLICVACRPAWCWDGVDVASVRFWAHVMFPSWVCQENHERLQTLNWYISYSYHHIDTFKIPNTFLLRKESHLLDHFCWSAFGRSRVFRVWLHLAGTEWKMFKFRLNIFTEDRSQYEFCSAREVPTRRTQPLYTSITMPNLT